MASTITLVGKVTITSKTINNDSVAVVFNNVTELEFQFYRGMVRILDADQGEFFFGLTLVTVVTDTINNNLHTVVIS
jgi:hypothetical protein